MKFIKLAGKIIVTICVAIVIIAFVFILYLFSAGGNIITMANEEISSGTTTAVLSDVGYDGAWFTGTITITDPYMDEYAVSHSNGNEIAEHFEDYYQMTYTMKNDSDVLPVYSGGYRMSEDDGDYYYQNFRIFNSEADVAVKVEINVNGIDKPFKVTLK